MVFADLSQYLAAGSQPSYYRNNFTSAVCPSRRAQLTAFLDGCKVCTAHCTAQHALDAMLQPSMHGLTHSERTVHQPSWLQPLGVPAPYTHVTIATSCERRRHEPRVRAQL